MKQKFLSELQLTDILLFAPVVLVILTQLLPSNVILGLLSMIVICTFPGYALLNRFKLHRSSRFQDLFLSVLFSNLLLQSVYMAYSVFCYGIGFKNSITKPQVFLIAVVILLISSFSLRNKIEGPLISEHIFDTLTKLRGKKFVFCLIPIALPLTALIAVTRLNLRNDSVTTAVFLYVCIGILVILCSGMFLNRSAGLHYSVFYSTLLALLFGSTFRGDGGFWGWDINQEFAVATRVLLDQHWIPIAQSPYNSMLSVSVLPVVLSFLTNFSLSTVFKLFYPLLGALIPLASYSLLRRFVRNSIAMPVVIIETIGSISYIQQMTALARQVVGLAFFVGVLLVLFDPVWDRNKKTKVILFLMCGLSFSHYSSAYLCSIIFLLAGLITFILRRVSSFYRKNFMPVTTLGLGVAILAITFLWNGALNNSAQDINTVSKSLVSKGPQFLPNKTGNFIDRWLSGVNTSPESTPEKFKSNILEFNSYKFPNLELVPTSLAYEIKPAEYPRSEPLFGTITATAFYWLYVFINTTFQFLIFLHVFLATIFLIKFLFKRKKELFKTSHSKTVILLMDLIPLALVSLSLALFLRTSGTSGGFYNAERAAFQLALIFSMSIALILERFIRWTKRSHQTFYSALILSCIVFLQSGTGLIGYIYGSPSSRISSIVSGDSPFVISQNERSAADWINQKIPYDSYLQSDVTANLVNLQKNIFVDRPFIAQTAPFGIFMNSYVYLSKANLDTGITRQSVGGLTAIRVPFDYLNENLSVVYSSGGARVYR